MCMFYVQGTHQSGLHHARVVESDGLRGGLRCQNIPIIHGGHCALVRDLDWDQPES